MRFASAENGQPGQPRFEVLDSLRGLCACLVVLHHLSNGATGHLASSAIIAHAWLFVDFFFVLSGAVIARRYLSVLSEKRDFLHFMILRLGRIWPLHLFVLAVMLIFSVIRSLLRTGADPVSARALSDLVTSALFLRPLGLFDHLVWNWPSWSAEAEMWAYLVFGLLVLGLRRFAYRAFITVAIAAGIGLLMLTTDFLHATYDFGILRCLYGFSLGVLISPFLQRARHTDWMRASLLEGGACVATIMAVSFVSGIATMGLPLLFAGVVLVFSRQGGFLSAALASRPFVALGRWSYSIYMIHGFVQLRYVALLNMIGGILGIPLAAHNEEAAAYYAIVAPPFLADVLMLLMLAIVIFLSSFSYRFVEEPARRLSRRLADKFRAKNSLAGFAPSGHSPV